MKLNDKFLKSFKKNDIIIYVIALMLVTAGYFNYSINLDEEVIETYSENIAITTDSNDIFVANNLDSENIANVEGDNTAINTSTNDNDIGDARLVNSNEVVAENGETQNSSEEDDEEIDNSDYFASSKLERDKNYASMISTYTEIIEDESVSETQKAIAMQEITEINDIQNAISICENLFSTKGFTNTLVLINNESVNVVVEVEDKEEGKSGLSTDKVAQIQNIITRELDADIENIHITEV